ncbi:MAG: hypothetical protein ISR65_11980 [Bacteriovoracaceae bacterium]|nr:hypothetical protein [Bacteriovoracaceae bacterium]
MKCFILLMAALLSFSTLATDLCNLELDGRSFSNVEDPEEPQSSYYFKYVKRVDNVTISEQLFKSTPILSDFDYEECKSSLTELYFSSPETMVTYRALNTFEDSCDGGNSYGVIYDPNETIVGYIKDSDFYCSQDY